MAISVADVIARFKSDVGRVLSSEVIQQVCADLVHEFRDRVLGPVALIHTFLIQILHGNVACSALPHLTGQLFTAAAYVKARTRLPLAIFSELLRRVMASLSAERQTTGLWHGHRTWLMDGSSFSMPDRSELQNRFGQPGGQRRGCGFPVAHLLALFHTGTGLLQRVIASPLRTHDMAQAAVMHPEMTENDILVADRGYASFAHLGLILLRKLHAVFRCHQRQIVDFRSRRRHTERRRPQRGLPRSRWLRRLGRHDQLVEYSKPTSRPSWMNAESFAALPDMLVVRELRYKITQRGRRTRTITLVTTLIDADRYSATALAELYEQRWKVETNMRHLKTTMKMEVLRCQSPDGVMKELAMFALAYNLVRVVMLEAARRQEVPVDRISFIDALRWLRSAGPDTPLPDLIVHPRRPERFEPRVVKRRPKNYKLMTRPRQQLRNKLLNQPVAA
jgi:hypothetical protein